MKRGTAWSEEGKDEAVKYKHCTPEFVEWAVAHEQNKNKEWVDPANRMTEEAVAEAEAKWSIVFPPDYRAFLVLGGPGSKLVRWDGTQDKLIAELYAKLEKSVVGDAEWGPRNEAWEPSPDDDNNREKAMAIAKSQYSKSRKLIPLSHRHFTFSYVPGRTEACMSLALSSAQYPFDVQDIMMVGDNFTRFFHFKCFTVARFEHVNSDDAYKLLKDEAHWGVWVN